MPVTPATAPTTAVPIRVWIVGRAIIRTIATTIISRGDRNGDARVSLGRD
jgi:hypothetical protein